MSAFLQSVFAESTVVLFPVEFIIKSTVLILLAMALLPLIRTWTPAIRYQVLRSSFVAIGLLAIVWPVLPSWQMPASGIIDIGTFTSVSSADVENPARATSSMSGWILWPLAVWMIGVVVLGARFVFGLIAAHRLIGSGQDITNGDFLKLADRSAGDLGMTRSIRYIISDTVGIPMVVGIFRPTILIPPDLLKDSKACDMVLHHETAHVKRNDVFWITLASLISILLWFNPLIWVLKRRMIIESEYACDDYVLIAGGQARVYAEHLLHSARQISRLPRAIAASSTFNSELEGRIMSILANRKRAVSVRGIVNIGIIATMCLLILPLAGMSMMSAGDKASDQKTQQQQQEDEAKKAEKKKQLQMHEQEQKEKALKAEEQKQYQLQMQEQKEKAIKAKEQKQYQMQMQEQQQKEKAIMAKEQKQYQMQMQEQKQKDKAKKKAMKEQSQNIKLMPQIVHQEQPEYPKELIAKEVEGVVVVKAYVTGTGNVKKAEIGKSSGYKLMDQAALDAAYKSKFKPAIDDNGSPVGAWIKYKVVFDL